MQFKRSKGNFRETDRVVRFKLIKSGKNWLRASTAALGLFRVVRGQVEETIIANVQQDQIESQKHNQAFLKGLITVGTVLVVLCLLRQLGRRMQHHLHQRFLRQKRKPWQK